MPLFQLSNLNYTEKRKDLLRTPPSAAQAMQCTVWSMQVVKERRLWSHFCSQLTGSYALNHGHSTAKQIRLLSLWLGLCRDASTQQRNRYRWKWKFIKNTSNGTDDCKYYIQRWGYTMNANFATRNVQKHPCTSVHQQNLQAYSWTKLFRHTYITLNGLVAAAAYSCSIAYAP